MSKISVSAIEYARFTNTSDSSKPEDDQATISIVWRGPAALLVERVADAHQIATLFAAGQVGGLTPQQAPTPAAPQAAAQPHKAPAAAPAAAPVAPKAPAAPVAPAQPPKAPAAPKAAKAPAAPPPPPPVDEDGADAGGDDDDGAGGDPLIAALQEASNIRAVVVALKEAGHGAQGILGWCRENHTLVPALAKFAVEDLLTRVQNTLKVAGIV
jgi:hypothetical protein